MPSKTPAQAKFMRAAANDPAFAAKNKIPQSVAKEFVVADQKNAPQPKPSAFKPRVGKPR